MVTKKQLLEGKRKEPIYYMEPEQREYLDKIFEAEYLKQMGSDELT